jgi:hypothetical protein
MVCVNQHTLVVAFVGIALLHNQFGARADSLRTVALTGYQAPGTLSGTEFSGFFAPALNNAGETAFWGSLRVGTGDVDTSNGTGIWSEQNGSLSLVARANDQAPGTPSGAVFRVFETQIRLSEMGDVAFVGELRIGTGGVTSNNQYGIWSRQQDLLSIVARERDPAPGTAAGASFLQIGRQIQESDPHLIAFSDSGQVAFYGRLVNNSSGEGGVTNANRGGIWAQQGGITSLLIREGDQAPGTPPESVFSLTLTDVPVINGSGKVAFAANLSGAAVTTSNDRGIWANSYGPLSLVARKGMQAPGFEPGRIFGYLSEPVMNSNGDVAFISALQGPAPPAIPDTGIWSNRTGDLALVARNDSQAPGADAGLKFSHMTGVVLNSQASVAFTAALKGPNDELTYLGAPHGIWSDANGSLQPVAVASVTLDIPNGQDEVHEGTPVPGASPGTFFGSFGDFALNASGQVAFESTTIGVDTYRGIWAQDRAGVLRSIVHIGSQLDVDDGPGVDLRTVNDLYFASTSGNEDGRISAFNDFGQLAFAAWFNDGTRGVFVSNAATIPEPSGLIYLWAAALISSRPTRKLRYSHILLSARAARN